nr:MAG TPA: hypothetical protein [Caudoviricetes sp.]
MCQSVLWPFGRMERLPVFSQTHKMAVAVF